MVGLEGVVGPIDSALARRMGGSMSGVTFCLDRAFIL